MTFAPRIVLITDPSFDDEATLDVVERSAAALPPGALAVQLRNKSRPRVSIRPFADRLRLATRAHGAWLIINGDSDLAWEIGADGVHLGGGAETVEETRARAAAYVTRSPGARGAAPRHGHVFITVAAHTDGDLLRALASGADGALVSPIFASPGKGPPRGTLALESARALVTAHLAAARSPSSDAGLLLYALGGVDRSNAGMCAKAGADGVACIRALLASEDPGAEARALYEAMDPR